MNRLALGAALVALGLTAGAGRAEEPAAPRAPWYKRWFGLGSEPPKMAPPPARDAMKDAAIARARAEVDLDRRQRVCDELRRIAEQNNDKKLWARADDLDRQALDLYVKQTASLPCSKLVPSRDERALDQRLGTSTASSAAADKLMTPPINVPSSNAQASAVREIKP